MSFRLLNMGVVVLGLVVAIGCSGKQPRVMPPSINASGAASAAIEEYDKDSDGAIGGAELDAVPSIKYAMAQKRIDKDGDGKVTADEIQTRIEEWQATKVAVTNYGCKVLVDGQPLKDGTVTFEPEAFLGEAVKGCTGKTTEHGDAFLEVPDLDPQGCHIGLYKVKITSASKTLPAKYNTATTLGEEIAQDAQSGEQRTFNLSSR